MDRGRWVLDYAVCFRVLYALAHRCLYVVGNRFCALRRPRFSEVSSGPLSSDRYQGEGVAIGLQRRGIALGTLPLTKLLKAIAVSLADAV